MISPQTKTPLEIYIEIFTRIINI